jgi:hypothetical protein
MLLFKLKTIAWTLISNGSLGRYLLDNVGLSATIIAMSPFFLLQWLSGLECLFRRGFLIPE